MNIDVQSLPTIASAAMLGSLNISVWEGRKKDKQVEEEIQHSKGAKSKRAASVHKHLFAESPALEAIKALRGEARVWFNRVTLPWDDNGNRIVTSAQYFEVMSDYQRFKQRFDDLVRIFISVYPAEISKQAFEMGALFNRNDYPDVNEIASKFSFNLHIMPLPMAGDFRVDIGNQALEELKAQCERDTQERLKQAMQDAWGRIKTQVEWIRDRMDAVLSHKDNEVEEEKEYDDAGNVVKVNIKKKRRPKLHQSMIDNGLELCGLLRDLNITNDPKLEEARQDLERAIVHIDIDSLRESTVAQEATKKKMDEILSKFNF
jgi:hypothetical protein